MQDSLKTKDARILGRRWVCPAICFWELASDWTRHWEAGCVPQRMFCLRRMPDLFGNQKSPTMTYTKKQGAIETSTRELHDAKVVRFRAEDGAGSVVVIMCGFSLGSSLQAPVSRVSPCLWHPMRVGRGSSRPRQIWVQEQTVIEKGQMDSYLIPITSLFHSSERRRATVDTLTLNQTTWKGSISHKCASCSAHTPTAHVSFVQAGRRSVSPWETHEAERQCCAAHFITAPVLPGQTLRAAFRDHLSLTYTFKHLS